MERVPKDVELRHGLTASVMVISGQRQAQRKRDRTVQRIDSHNNFFFFTISLVFLLVASAYVSSTPKKDDHLILQGLMFLSELVAYLSLSLSQRWRVFIVIILILNGGFTLLREFSGWETNPIIGLCVGLAFYSGMAYVAAKQVLFSDDIEFNTIIGTLAVYLLLGIIWTGLYLLALEFWPEGIEGIQYADWHENFGITAYFSYVTMTTLGYGDITPVVPIIRTLAYLQALTGTFYLAVVVASLVGAFARRTR